jgi:hypothetical protein
MGFVWNWIEYRWDNGFKNLLKFRKREGHCRVPTFHCEGKYKLGWWVSTQRRRKNKMSAKQRARLNKIGFVWKEKAGPIGSRCLIRFDPNQSSDQPMVL